MGRVKRYGAPLGVPTREVLEVHGRGLQAGLAESPPADAHRRRLRTESRTRAPDARRSWLHRRLRLPGALPEPACVLHLRLRRDPAHTNCTDPGRMTETDALRIYSTQRCSAIPRASRATPWWPPRSAEDERPGGPQWWLCGRQTYFPIEDCAFSGHWDLPVAIWGENAVLVAKYVLVEPGAPGEPGGAQRSTSARSLETSDRGQCHGQNARGEDQRPEGGRRRHRGRPALVPTNRDESLSAMPFRGWGRETCP